MLENKKLVTDKSTVFTDLFTIVFTLTITVLLSSFLQCKDVIMFPQLCYCALVCVTKSSRATVR